MVAGTRTQALRVRVLRSFFHTHGNILPASRLRNKGDTRACKMGPAPGSLSFLVGGGQVHLILWRDNEVGAAEPTPCEKDTEHRMESARGIQEVLLEEVSHELSLCQLNFSSASRTLA